MHRFLVLGLEPPLVRFSAPQAHQLRSVLRLRKGDRVRVFDGATPCDLVVELTGVDEGRVVERLAQPPEPRTRLVAYPALVQRDKFEQILQKLTEVGAADVVPVLCERSLVRTAPDEARQARWEAIVREAAEQSGRGVVPVLHPALPFQTALDAAVAAGRTLIAYEGEHTVTIAAALAAPDPRPLEYLHLPPDTPRTVEHSSLPRRTPRALEDPGDARLSRRADDARSATGAERPCVACFVGPEGGFSPREIEHARARGAHTVTLGPRILRTETAAPIVAALVLYALGDLSSW